MMSFFAENKLIFGALGLAVSSAALGFVFGRSSERSSPDSIFVDVGAEGSPLAKYVLSYGIRESAPLKQLRQATLNHPRKGMISSADGSQLIRLLLQLIKAKKVIEVGVYTGYNTLSMAMSLPADGKVVACDITDKFMKEVQSQQYFKEAGVESKVDLRLQSAVTTLDELLAAGEAGSFDLVFIDADKTGYEKYYEKSLQLLHSGGLIVIDNVLWKGRVCNPEKIASEEDTRALHNLNVKVHGDSRVVMCMVPFADGVTIAMKL
ncbi:hypothetical protein ACROYT_G005308 [Oculina patagonica]